MGAKTVRKDGAQKKAVARTAASSWFWKAKASRTAAARCKRQPPRVPSITVVDAHHHALKPMWEAAATGRLPRRGVKLLHFDSHPDMGTLGSELDGAAIGSEHKLSASDRAQLARVKALLPRLHADAFNKEECLYLSDIATWVPSLVFQGFVDEVIWVCGAWCNQIKTGTLNLVVGRSKKDGMMRIATTDGTRPWYWATDGILVPLEDLEMRRPWLLHVFRFTKQGTLRPDHVAEIVSVCGKNPWILDIDEDYLSTQNPFTLHFRHMFGEDHFATLLEVFSAEGSDDYGTALETIAEEGLYQLSPAAYSAHDSVRTAELALTRKGGMQKRKASELLAAYRGLCRAVLRTGGRELTNSMYSEFKADTLIMAGSLQDLPHHISTMAEMLRLVQSTKKLFDAIRKPPGVVTVATSRADEYTPEPQAFAIHDMVLGFLKEQYARGTREPRIFRRDLRDGLSVYDLDWEQNLRLFLGKGSRKAKFCTGVRRD